ncbi:hypothetical protein JFV29_12345 [Peribacillus sp. TH16]|uniref:hypothetical protein n=1 Tax=Peribacillus sp. TH16 TaxID=2798482 RepID=UPI001911F9A6|nr:hypothetical protein [Peribacillus sp. TH16]MBK5482673.1 hypothetical protein [Peribacillus sp. TH16]
MKSYNVRLIQIDWTGPYLLKILTIYAGRLSGESVPNESQRANEIDLAEKLLIYVHKPADNSKNLNNIPDQDLQDVHILNWESSRDLFPEISGLRWTTRLDSSNYEVYSLK